MKRRIRKWEEEYAAGMISREKIEESFRSWEAHAKHGDTGTLRKNMRARLDAALARAAPARGTPHPYGGKAADGCAEIHRAALCLPAPDPDITERRTKRYGTVTFQSGRREPRETE